MKRRAAPQAVAAIDAVLCVAFFAALCATAPAFAQTTPGATGAEEAALALADKTEDTAEKVADWRVFVEGAARWGRRADGTAVHTNRLSLDVRFDSAIAPGWRAVFADRYDAVRSDAPRAVVGPGLTRSASGDVNTLKEAYVSWQRDATGQQPKAMLRNTTLIADLGRVNVRNGVASGYNPTDFFRSGALRSVVSLDPPSLRENRLGSGMLRGQAVWEGGSLTGIYSPKLDDAPSSEPYSLDLGSTNRRERWQVAYSHELAKGISPQWLLSGGDGQSAHLGLNVTTLLNTSTVAFLEWSGGRSLSLLGQALASAPALASTPLARPEDKAFRSRLATGLSYTTSFNLTLTAEYDYNGAAPSEDSWDALRRGPSAAYAAYRAFTAYLQDPPTRHSVFLYALWQDAFVRRLDIASLLRYDPQDSSRLQWLEARYRWTKVDATLQLQFVSGAPASNYGALAEHRSWQMALRYYF